MAAQDWVVIPDDLISEESDFHGDGATRKAENRMAETYNPRKYWQVHHWNVQVIAAQGRKARLEQVHQHRDQDAGSAAEPQRLATMEPTLDRIPKVEAGDGGAEPHDPADEMDLDVKVGTQAVEKPRNHFEERESAKQLSESVSDFLARLPPSTTSIMSIRDPWIWIANPHPPAQRYGGGDPGSGDGDVSTFRQLGYRLLDKFTAKKTSVEEENAGKPAGSITRMLRPDRLNLENDIKDLAKKQGVTAGKWMLFPGEAEVDHVWATVAQGVWDGKFGTTAKVAALEDDAEISGADNQAGGGSGRDSSQRLVCVYTRDFTDQPDVLRVLRAMKETGLLDLGGASGSGSSAKGGGLKVIYYKCDAYTYLDLSSGNDFKLKASMYCSRDLVPEWYPAGNGHGHGSGKRPWAR